MPEAKILIVEDEAIAAMDIQQSLVGFGYPLPDIAYTGEEGLRKVGKTQPDLVLMDIMMPEKIDGVAAAEQIRARFDIPVIFLTAYSDEKTLRRAKITAPYGYILKPFQERELLITVDMALYRHKLERELRERKKWLETTLRSIGDGVIATDEKGLITFINPVAEGLLGCKLEEVQQRNLTEVFNIVNKDTRKPVENPVTKVMLEGNIVGLANHTVLISMDGREIPINDSAAPIKDDRGNILGVILVFSDISEREKAEEALRESQTENEFLAGLIRASSQPVAIGYPDGRLGLLNRAFEELTGYTGDELRAINWATALTPPEWLDMERDKLAELHRTGQSVHYEKEYIRKDGTRVPVELLVQLVSDSEGKPQYYYAFLTDLTERKQAEQKVLKLNEELRRSVAGLSVANASLRDSRRATLNIMEDALAARKKADEVSVELRQSEERLRLLIENVKGYAIFMLDPEGRVITWNEGAERLKGYKEDEIVGQHFSLFYPAEEAAGGKPRRELETAMAEGRVEEEGWRVRKDGSRFWASVLITSLRDEEGALRGFTKITRDITERKRAEEALRQSEERLKRAQNIAHLGSWELDLINNTLSWSDEVYRIFGLQPQEFGATYEAFLEAVHPEDRRAVDEAYSGSVREGKDTYEIEHRVVRASSGEIRTVLERCQHFRDGTGRIIRSVGMVHDITELKKAEEDVLKLSEDMASRNLELESVNKELEAFIYSVSHDLRAPLRSVSSFAEFLVEDCSDRLDSQGRDYVARINKGAARMSRLIEDLLYLSKISRQDVTRTKIDLSKLALSIISELRDNDASRNVDVNIAGDIIAFADPRLIEIALSNLLGNAWKFTLKTKDACIEFGSLEQDGRPVYYVKDNGAGFDPEYSEKMFLPFHRLHSGEEFEGMGIGLTIVERVIRRHGGRIWAEGEVGKGAAVYFTLGSTEGLGDMGAL